MQAISGTAHGLVKPVHGDGDEHTRRSDEQEGGPPPEGGADNAADTDSDTDTRK